MSIDFFTADTGVTLTAEIAFGVTGGIYQLWGTGLWGRAVWGPGVVYQDLSSRLRGFGTSRKFDRTLQRWQSGGGWMLLDNRDGDLSPANTAGTYTVAGRTTIRPARPARLRAAYGGVTYALLAGVVDDWQEEIISAGPHEGDAAVRVPIVDPWAELAGVDGVAVAAEGAGDTFGARVGRILDAAGWRGGRAIEAGEHTMQATTLDKVATAELEAVAQAEAGLVWPAADGTIWAAGRNHLIEAERSNTVQATWGDADADHLPYSSPKPTFDRRLLCNQATYERTGGTAQTATDTASRGWYGLHRSTETGLICETDAQAATLAQWYVTRFREPRQRIEQITAYPRARPDALWPVVLGARELDLWRVVHHPPSGTSHAIDLHEYVSGISHQVLPGGDWRATFDLWSASPYFEFAGSRWGVGTWGTSRWFL